jgi:hypothetical protein
METIKICKLWGDNLEGIPIEYPQMVIENHPKDDPLPEGFVILTDQEIEQKIQTHQEEAITILENLNKIYNFVLTKNRDINQLIIINFKDTNLCEAKKFPTVKGELREIEYYMDSAIDSNNQITYINKAVKETNSWEYFEDLSSTPAKKFPLKRFTKIEFFLTDGTIGHTIDTYKHYNLNFQADIIEAITKRHNNIISEVYSYLYTVLSFTQVVDLINNFDSEISKYKNGNGLPLYLAISQSNLSYLTQEIKNQILDIITY